MLSPSSRSKKKPQKKNQHEADCLAYSSTLKMEAACSSETSVDFRHTTWCYITEGTLFNNNEVIQFMLMRFLGCYAVRMLVMLPLLRRYMLSSSLQLKYMPTCTQCNNPRIERTSIINHRESLKSVKFYKFKFVG
jgi:hypothetical protein